MSTTRKLQWNKTGKVFFSVFPKVLVDALGLKPGDMLTYRIENNRVIIETPEAALLPGTTTSRDCTTPYKEVVQHG